MTPLSHLSHTFFYSGKTGIDSIQAAIEQGVSICVLSAVHPQVYINDLMFYSLVFFVFQNQNFRSFMVSSISELQENHANLIIIKDTYNI